MKPLIVFSDVTIDGFMAGLDNDLDFMVNDPQLEDELTGMSFAAVSTRRPLFPARLAGGVRLEPLHKVRDRTRTLRRRLG
jgi:hypothetical protein